ncbi:hypothetical protein RZS08_33240, partial [Arthrospira platensis SPKY1]|nr:hypothetical protein [Arthrospira platensis SPKY1]
ISQDAQQFIAALEDQKLRLIELDWRGFSRAFPGMGQPFTRDKALLLKKGMFRANIGVETVCTRAFMAYNPQKVESNPSLAAAMSKLKPQATQVFSLDQNK